jgi:hypothetical protein
MPRGPFSPISLSIVVACAALAAPACGKNVYLGDIGDASSSLLWRATFEPGDLSEWVGDGQGGTYVANAPAPPAAARGLAHNGQYAGLATFTGMTGTPSIDYLFRHQPSPPEAYYSAWFYIPSSFVVKGWLSVTHFRGSSTGDGNNLVPLWDVNLYPRPDGSLVAHLYNYTTMTNLEEVVPVPVPLDTWVQFEVLLHKAADASGRVAVWQDGVLVVDWQAVISAPTDWVEWDAGGSSDGVAPSPAVLYIDDAAISLARVGTGN